jgi:predicted TIM-barrel fold metal-dependent hydrolase
MGRHGYFVVDGDGHAVEPIEIWERYLDEPYRSIRPRLVTDNRGVPRVLVDGWMWTAPPGPGVGHPEGFPREGRRKLTGGGDPRARLEDMDREGIDVAVLFATVTMGPAAGVLPSGDAGLEAALCHAYNSWIADYAATDAARLKPVAVLPTRDIPAAVRELARCVEQLGFVGVEIPTNSQGRLYPGDRHFFPIYDEARRLGVPVFLHPHAGGQILYAGRERFSNFFYGHMLAFPFEAMLAAMHLVGEGVLDRFPELTVGILESGVGWVPYWFERMDEHYAKLSRLVPGLKRLPSEWAKAPNLVFSCDPDEETLPAVVEWLGTDRIIYASDYPHWDAKTPDSVRLLATRDDLGDEVKRKILGENAARVYRLAHQPAATP